MVSVLGYRIGPGPIVATAVLTLVVLLTWLLNLGPSVLIGAAGFVVILLYVVTQGVVRQTLRRGPVWDEDAQQSRHETTEAAAELAELRRQRDRGDLSSAEFERRADNLLDTDSVATARQYIEQQRELTDEGKVSEEEGAAESERSDDTDR
jgi:flagellar biosynthesis/type III secretory pathway M-ring protein FliF/YscJ